MNSVQKLIELGCGKEIINSQIERGSLHASIYNATLYLKEAKRMVKSGIITQEQANEWDSLYNSYKELKSVEHLAHKYKQLYLEKFCKIKLQIEKFTNNIYLN